MFGTTSAGDSIELARPSSLRKRRPPDLRTSRSLRTKSDSVAFEDEPQVVARQISVKLQSRGVSWQISYALIARRHDASLPLERAQTKH